MDFTGVLSSVVAPKPVEPLREAFVDTTVSDTIVDLGKLKEAGSRPLRHPSWPDYEAYAKQQGWI